MKVRLLALLLVASTAAAQRQPVAANSMIYRPERLPWSSETPRELRAPDGFAIQAYATGLGAPRMMALGPDGTVYVTRGDSGDVVALKDNDGDGRADSRVIVASRLPGVHGIAIRDNRFYFATTSSVFMAEGGFDGRPGPTRMILEGLPNGGQHARRTIQFGPDGMMYISVGSTCNDCAEPNPENATILRVSPNGMTRTVYAKGLRNTLGWAWHPQTRELWGFDHGSDFRGNDVPPEELNLIREGGNYGWPFCYGQRTVDRWSHYDPPNRMTPEAYCGATEPAALMYQPHSAPIGFVFYTGSQFPSQYQGDAFVSMHGSWNRSPAAPAKIIRVRFQNGRPTRAEDFVTGFLRNNGQSLIGRPAGLLVAADGSLLVSDDANGAIYRVSYGGPGPVNSNTSSNNSQSSVTVDMRDADNRDLGALTINEMGTGLEITGTLRNLTPGMHGIHLHAVGQCAAPFTSAGGHWNPLQRQHGIDNPQGPHFGDLQNIRVDGRGTAVVRVTAPGGSLFGAPDRSTGGRVGRPDRVTLAQPALVDADGAAIVIHAEPDDYRTDPSGNSGARIACGVIPRR
jgi:glucose/arabinose dehydrogenase/Cu/Zn superoxide dismutase